MQRDPMAKKPTVDGNVETAKRAWKTPSYERLGINLTSFNPGPGSDGGCACIGCGCTGCACTGSGCACTGCACASSAS